MLALLCCFLNFYNHYDLLSSSCLLVLEHQVISLVTFILLHHISILEEYGNWLLLQFIQLMIPLCFLSADTDSVMEIVGENTFADQKSHHRCRRKKHDCRMIDSVR